jgi:hypothetical protein
VPENRDAELWIADFLAPATDRGGLRDELICTASLR